jgi:D-beta-D-heptose 7-phosphate kinase/D-beta-D-heptose 1-phosphate adenosyltransferase
MGSSDEQILKTLLYSDIFDYPLRKEEIWNFLISPVKQNKKEIFKCLNVKNSRIESKSSLFFVKGRKDIVTGRIEREKHSLQKIIFARNIIRKLAIIPTVYFVGISGALAMRNSNKDDDIDLFVVAARNSVWTTRLLMVILLSLLGVYRRKNDKNVSDKICLNMLIDENALSFPKERNDLYTAHEISQIMPVFNRGKTYERLLSSNTWIKEFLPNVFEKKSKTPFASGISLVNKIINRMLRIIPVEIIARNLQTGYMKKNITKETVSGNFLAFHPFDYKRHILNSYKRKLSENGVQANTRGY